MTPLNDLDLSLFVKGATRTPKSLSDQELVKEIVTAATLVAYTYKGPFSPEKVGTFLKKYPAFHLKTGCSVTALVEEAMEKRRLKSPTGILLNYMVAKHLLFHRLPEAFNSGNPGKVELEVAGNIKREFDQAFALKVPAAIKCFGANLFAKWPGGRPNDAVVASSLADRDPR